MALFLVLVLSLCITCYKADAGSKTLLNEQYHFTATNSIMHQVDDDFDCVDIYKQPALQNPLLKNHKIQLYPSFANNTVRSGTSYDGKKVNRCSAGEVPIYKRTRRHQISTNTSLQFQTEDFRQFTQSSPGHHTVTYGTLRRMTFHGAHAYIGAYNLSLKPNQYSISSVWIEGGPSTELNGIHAGIGVFPYIYGDSQLRFTTLTTVNGYKTKCYNNLCSSFVQVNQDKNYALGSIDFPTSTIGSRRKYYLPVKIKQDRATGHWWLILNEESIIVGYWPKELFSHLSTGATWIRFGGETYAPANEDSPPMGSGRLPKEGLLNSGFIARLQIIDSEYHEIDLKSEDLYSYIDVKPDCYDLSFDTTRDFGFGKTYLYGGPGGKCGI